MIQGSKPPLVPGREPRTWTYLRPQELQMLRRLRFVPRKVKTGLYAGRHHSPQRGQSIEFNDYREYVPGDELGSLDWKVYGRSDRLYLKLYEHQTDMGVHLVVDASASMRYHGMLEAPAIRRPGSPARDLPVTKLDAAFRLAAAIAFLVIKQQDKVGFSTLQGGLKHPVPARGRFPHLERIMRRMEDTLPSGEADVPLGLQQLALHLKRRSMIILVSDLLDEEEATIREMNRLIHRGHELILFHLLHPHEISLPSIGSAEFRDSENGQRVRIDVNQARADYERDMAAFLRRWQAASVNAGIEYNLAMSTRPVMETLRDHLVGRAAAR